MTKAELKARLKSKIDKINDIAFLKELDGVLAPKAEGEQYFPLTEAQKKSIAMGQEQIKKGQYKSHEDVMKEARILLGSFNGKRLSLPQGKKKAFNLIDKWSKNKKKDIVK